MTDSSWSLTPDSSAREDPDLDFRPDGHTARSATYGRPVRMWDPGATRNHCRARSGIGERMRRHMSKSSRKKRTRKKSSANHGNRPNA